MAFAAPDSREDFPFEAHSGHAGAIGAPLEAARLRLLGMVERLGGLLGEHAAPLLDAARRQLEERSCRIAVIGQIKAGKSTFINALARRPSLLPTDINPWTVVVTTLHFRRAPTPPEHAAVFQLFSPEEWNELAEGGGRLRELTERLVPGFQLDLLRAQLEVMRKRAESHLGPKFAELLGQCHRYQTVTPELLTDYVSAGAGADETWPGKRRHYSDITRSADLYFNDSPFAFPLTLIDTPGTNDPFLVRDEITRRSLENPDIYVFVVSALQPLSAADIAMLRLLNGLHKDRIVVFINRADQLPNLSGDAEVVKAAVEKRLRAEFPSLQIPVVYGSAWLGNLRLQPEAGERSALMVPGSSAVRLECAVEVEPATASDAASETTPGQTDALRTVPAVHMNSGMGDVSAAITRLMCDSSIAMLLRQIAVCLAELVRTADVSDGAELQSIRELLQARRQEAEAVRNRVSDEEQSLAAFEERVKALLVSFGEVDTHFKEVIATAGSVLRDQLGDLVREFATSEADALLASLAENARPRQWIWRCNALPLREQMEATYLAAFAQAARDLDRVEQFLYPQLRMIVASLLPNYHGGLLEVPAWPEGLTPSVAPLSDKVTVDLGVSWWRRWFASRRLAKERANHLLCLIEEDFSKIAEDLVEEAQTHLAERVDYIMRRVNAISNGLRTGVERRTANLARERALIDRAGDEQDQKRFETEQQRRAEGCAARQEAYAAVLGELEAVLGGLDSAQDESRPE
jgi:signal recognition particle receptor subunit beta